MKNPQDQKAIDSAERRAHESNKPVMGHPDPDDPGYIGPENACHCTDCVGDPDPGPVTCPTCCRPLGEPYRQRIRPAASAAESPDNFTMQGCVDQCHGPHLKEGSADFRWHFHCKAERIREMVRLGVPL